MAFHEREIIFRRGVERTREILRGARHGLFEVRLRLGE